MVAGLKVGAVVIGKCSSVLPKGDFEKGKASTTIRGIVVAKEGSGRGQKWVVDWENPKKMSTVPARRLALDTGPPDQSSDDETSNADSEASDESESSDEEDPIAKAAPTTPATAVDPNCPHGLLWKKVSVVDVDFRTDPKDNFRLRWSNDLSMDQRNPIDFFFALFPSEILKSVVTNTNVQLKAAQAQELTEREFLILIGLVYAMAVFDLGDRRLYWSVDSIGGVVPAPNFGRWGMGVNRFEKILSHLRIASDAEAAKDPWAHARQLIDHFNSHRSQQVRPSWRLCVDEKISAFRPRKGPYFSDAIPHLTKIVRKPEGVGTELRDCTDGSSRVTLSLEIQEGKLAMSGKEFSNKYSTSGAAAVLRLTKPWFNTGRLVVGDSAFASVETAIACRDHGLHFTGLVKTAHKKFPKNVLSQLPLPAKGDHAVMSADPTPDIQLLAVAWNGGKQRKLFVSTCGTTTLAEKKAIRTRYRDRGDGLSEVVQKETDWPCVVRTYFETANASDVHNHLRQGTLAVEKSWVTQTWWHRILGTVLGICEVDAFLAFKALHPAGANMEHRDFVLSVADHLLRGDYAGFSDVTSSSRRKRKEPEIAQEVSDTHSWVTLASLPFTHDTRRCVLRCRVCGSKASFCCEECSRPPKGEFFALCGPQSSKRSACFHLHSK